MRCHRRCSTALLYVMVFARASAAQSTDAGRFEIGGGVRVLGALHISEASATETTAGGGSRPLFNTRTDLDASAGFGATLGLALTRALRLESTLSVNSTRLSSRISADAEQVSNATVRVDVTQLLIEGGAAAQLRRLQRGRVRPFAAAGLGYVRHLSDGRRLVETGTALYAGGGLFYVRASTRPRRLAATGIRIDARAIGMRGGVAEDTVVHWTPAIAASVFARF